MHDPEWQRLMSWGRATQARHRLPALFLFTDPRAGNPLPTVARMPPGGAGVVFRHDSVGRAARAALLRRVMALCRARRLVLSVGGRTHWRAASARPSARAMTAAVHNPAELRRAHRAGARFAFISPVFATRSHPGAPPLGVVRATRLALSARRLGMAAYALGGLNSRTAVRLPKLWAGLGAIDGLQTAAALVSGSPHRALIAPGSHPADCRCFPGSP